MYDFCCVPFILMQNVKAWFNRRNGESSRMSRIYWVQRLFSNSPFSWASLFTIILSVLLSFSHNYNNLEHYRDLPQCRQRTPDVWQSGSTAVERDVCGSAIVASDGSSVRERPSTTHVVVCNEQTNVLDVSVAAPSSQSTEMLLLLLRISHSCRL